MIFCSSPQSIGSLHISIRRAHRDSPETEPRDANPLHRFSADGLLLSCTATQPWIQVTKIGVSNECWMHDSTFDRTGIATLMFLARKMRKHLRINIRGGQNAAPQRTSDARAANVLTRHEQPVDRRLHAQRV